MFLEKKSDVYSYHVLDTYSVLQTYTAGCVKLIHLMKAKFRQDQNQAVLTYSAELISVLVTKSIWGSTEMPNNSKHLWSMNCLTSYSSVVWSREEMSDSSGQKCQFKKAKKNHITLILNKAVSLR